MGHRKGNERNRDEERDSVYKEEEHIVEEIVDDVSLENEMQKLREEKEVQDTKMRALSCNMYKLDEDVTSIRDTMEGLKQSVQTQQVQLNW